MLRRPPYHTTLVLVSGMRTTTLFQRLAFLPRADAYASECGGRIFYPVPLKQPNSPSHFNNRMPPSHAQLRDVLLIVTPPALPEESVSPSASSDSSIITTAASTGTNANTSRWKLDQAWIEPFGIVEDLTWKARMMINHVDTAVTAVGANPQLQHPQGEGGEHGRKPVMLWKFAHLLQEQHRIVIDSKGYSMCFRVNWKQQQKLRYQVNIKAEDIVTTASTHEDENMKQFVHSLMDINLSPWGLARSVNLGCVDFYPVQSGKKNWYVFAACDVRIASCLFLHSTFSHSSSLRFWFSCAYLAQQFCLEERGIIANTTTPTTTDENLLFERAICLCDDDNDLEMAMACRKAYVPSVSSTSMADALIEYPQHIATTERPEQGVTGCVATEEALMKILAEFSQAW